MLFGGRPQPDALPWSLTTGSASALISTGTARGNRFQSLHAGVGVEAELAAEAAVDHQRNALDCDGAFSNGTGQHHGSIAGVRAALQCCALFLKRQLPVQRGHLPVPQRGRLLQQFPATADLHDPRQKNQHTTAPGK